MTRKRRTLPLAPMLAIPAVILLLAALYRARLGAAPTPRLPDLTLIDTAGRPVALSALPGRLRLVYFGYTHCPDICVTTLASMTRALSALGPGARQVTPVFITVDPARDTPAVLAAYDRAFSPVLVGLTGSPAAIARAARLYGITVYSHQGRFDHDAVLLLLADDGRLLAAWPAALSAAALQARLAPYVEFGRDRAR